MRVIVTGGRNYEDRATVWRVLDELHAERPIEVLVHGGATGADHLAHWWARAKGVPVEIFRVLPDEWRSIGPSAGPIRNKRMIGSGADMVVAFPGGRGTANCADLAAKAGIEVRRIS